MKKPIKKYVSWVLILTLVALLAALPAIASEQESVSGPQASILSAKSEKRDIVTAVLGGGTIATDDALQITIPADVKITEYLVSNGDVVTEGQAIARVDKVSVMTAITQVQETLEYLNKELTSIRTETETTKLTAPSSGTVKTVYATAGENVQDVMLRSGALAVISLDGLMAVQVQRKTDFATGDPLCVVLSDGTEVTGSVESNLDGILTVTVEDKDFPAGDKVKVTTMDGDRIGTGNLYIHSPWDVVAYSGTVSRVRIKEGAAVYAGQILFNLQDTGHTAEFNILSDQHREYEELMLELFKLYQSEAVVAPADGMVTDVDEDGAYMLSTTEGGWKITLLANGPGGDDNTYTNYVGQVTEVGIDGLIMRMNSQAISVADYYDLSGVPMNVELMTQNTTYIGSAPIYYLTDAAPETEPGTAPTTAPGETTPTEPAGGTQTKPTPDPGTAQPAAKQWVQVSPYSIVAGDILLFAGNGSGVVWVIKAGYAKPPQSTQPSQPGESTKPTEPGGNTSSGGRPGAGGGGMPSGGMPSGGMPSGGMGQEESEDLYTLDTVTIASLTAQDSVHIQITVDELDVLKLHKGQRAAVTVEALPGQQFAGTVTEISGSGENEGGNSKFTVEVTLEKTPDMLPGMRASVSVGLDTAEQVVCIPVAALIENGTETVVYRNYDEETGAYADPVTVTTGASDGEFVQILSGISQGETVYYPYYDTLIISNAPEGSGFSFG